MSEIEQLKKQKEEIETQQKVLKNWVTLKQNLLVKYKNAQEVFKALKKEDKEQLTVEDFSEYSKGMDLQQVFKDANLTEEGFIKIWEQWEYQYKQNEHKLQILEEKLELQTILEQKDNVKESAKQYEAQKNRKILHLIQNCESLDQLQEKLDSLVQGGQQQQKEKPDLIQNEQDCFQQIFGKKTELKQPDLQIGKIQIKLNTENEEIQSQSSNKQKKSYIDTINNNNNNLLKSKINLSIGNQNQSSNSSLQVSKLSTINNQTKPQQQQQLQQSYIFEQATEISPNKGRHFLKNPSISQQPQLRSPQEDREQERRSHKVNRMRGDLQSYISELFQNEPRQEIRKKQQKNFYQPSQSQDSKGLSGFPNYRKYFKNQNQFVQQEQHNYDNDYEGGDIQKRLQNIRYKLDDFQSQKLQQVQRRPKNVQEWTPERSSRPSQQKPRQNSGNRKQSPQYTPGNTHRLNLNKLKQEKEKDNQNNGSSQKQEGLNNQKIKSDEKKEFLSTEQLLQTINDDQQANP